MSPERQLLERHWLYLSTVSLQNRILSLALIIMSLSACGSGDDDAPEIPTMPAAREYNDYVLNDEFNGENYIVLAIESKGYLAAFKPQLTDGTSLMLEADLDNWPNILSDQSGSLYNFIGMGVSGPNTGKQLLHMNSQVGYWFSISAAFPTAIYPETVVNRSAPTFYSAEWNVDPKTVVSGALRDAISALNTPGFIRANDQRIIENSDFMAPDERVLVVQNSEVTKVYPYKILDRHEIVNDLLGDERIVVSYCPLTGTGTVWRSEVNGSPLEFGVSGLLSQSNLLLFDRATESLWSQIRKEAVYGELKDAIPTHFPHQEVLWGSIQDLPNLENVEVLSDNTGFDYDYDMFPYGDYRTDDNLIYFPIGYSDDRLPAKEIVLGVIVDEEAKVYRFSN